jgi:hypothetical protein
MISERIYDEYLEWLELVDRPIDSITSRIIHPRGKSYASIFDLITTVPNYSTIRGAMMNYGISGKGEAETITPSVPEIEVSKSDLVVETEIENTLEATWWESLDQMISRMDIISINCPHTEQTHHMIGKKQLSLLQKHAYLVNTSRGEIIDEKSLTEHLVNGSFAGAGLDVYEDEPIINDNLKKLNNVVLLPHIGSATIEGRVAMGEKVIINIKTVADGHTPPDLVLETMV